ncbi:undecaprenyl-diphosphate phosphatase [Marinobacter bryozoorum]|jgi:undecaprenyl-diphosphatase|uniref:undecaprenyl-diphosphate phosphatase n=1 Tax=Marinobacter bryozoorum TaxID=256324 RepID=UPI002002C91C|nr:undecaprenyl-diphosphate phosphatase [Marinobacter bryozoorum]MCK7545775.1 undecaprenyl-diphosphate phosphatase [Marinobacter bryozoorum]
MDWLQVVILSLVQGISEFLPISSSAHLILVPVMTNWQDQGLAFDVALHLGSLLAVVLYFRRDLITMTGSWFRSLRTRQPDEDARLAWAVLFGTIPVGLAGLAFKDTIETVLRSPLYLAAGLIVFGIVLAWADLRRRGHRTEAQINWKDVLVIGCAQALALFPGTSRSGITITAALLMGMNREAASRFSFLLSIPVIVLACGLQIKSLAETSQPVQWEAMAAGIALSGISAYLCIHYFLAFIKRIGMMPFVAYRIILGIILIGVFA